MADSAPALQPSTTPAAAAIAQTRGETDAPDGPPAERPRDPYAGQGTAYAVGPGVERAAQVRLYERQSDDPVYRPLRIFTIDPAASRREGSVALVRVPYEPLPPGPKSALFEVDDWDDTRRRQYRAVDLDDPRVLIQSGRDPSPTDPLFHQQMVYAVCSLVYAAFRSALGREIAWGFDRPGEPESGPPESGGPDSGGPVRLRIRPHAACEQNAFYDKARGELRFGYYRASEASAGRNLPGGWVFTCLSHDVVAHEVTHALLDGLRSRFTVPTGPDVAAFHEAFADLVAVFQHFSYEEVVRTAIRRARGSLQDARLLTDIAAQFGQTTRGADAALRSAIQPTSGTDQTPPAYDPRAEAHALGGVLVSAVFEAFVTVFQRKTERLVRLATGGSGVLPAGEISADLQAALAREASGLAGQFLAMCIRAVDYCPPVDVTFGEFLRAVITVDQDLVPDDPWGYREAWIDAFRRRKIYPSHVPSLSEDALRWRPPDRPVPRISRLSFAELRFQGDPGHPADERELREQACALGRVVSDPRWAGEFGLARAGDPGLNGDALDLPVVESIRSSRRAGPDGQIVFDLVAEVTQRRTVRAGDGTTFPFYGGATVILDPRGEIRYVIRKSVQSEDRLRSQREFLLGAAGSRLWSVAGGQRRPDPQLFRLLHADPSAERPDAERGRR